MDVKNAFLNGALKEEMYMRLPLGYEGMGFRFNTHTLGQNFNFNKSSTKVCRLIKTLYGLKQAPREWFEKLNTVLKEVGFIQSRVDSSLFTKQENGAFTTILAYVDDLILIKNSMEGISRAKEFLCLKFKMKDMGELRYFLGIEVDRSDQGIFLSQKKYITELLKEYNLLNCRPLKLPMDTHENFPLELVILFPS